MRFDEDAGDADRHRGARQRRRRIRAAPPEDVALPARLLHRMRGVEDHRRARSRAMIGSARMSVTSVL